MFGSRNPSPPPPYTLFPDCAASPLLQNVAREVNGDPERNDPPPNNESETNYGSFANIETRTRRPYSSATPNPAHDSNCAQDDTAGTAPYSISSVSLSVKPRVLVALLSIAVIFLLSFFALFRQRDAGADPAPHFSWTHLTDGNCVRRGTRESYARLLGSNPLTSACTSTPRAMNGTMLHPSRCTHPIWSEYGFWDTADEEGECVPYWTDIEAAACVAYETRTWTARLENVHYDAELACQEAPITLPSGDTFLSPSKCNPSQWKGSTTGEWLRRGSDDPKCIPFWTDVEPGRCLSYGVRDYKARLSNVNYDPWLACRDTPNSDLGVAFGPPLSCKLNGASMEGRWQVPEQIHCMPQWGEPKQDGCAGRGLMRFSSRLWGIQDADWMTMCRTTPIDIGGHHFEHPHGCDDHWIGGMWGYWLLPDDSCA